MYDHLLLTRFNVLSKDWQIRPSTNWMVDRIDIFKRYCLPSVSMQTNKNFTWILFFDKKTDSSLLFQVESLLQQQLNGIKYHIILIDLLTESNVTEKLSQIIKEDYIITSRLDNDDAIAHNYIKEIQKQFTPQNKTIINLDYGYTYNIKENRIYLRNHYINAFCSFIERSDDLRSVWALDHRELEKIGNLIRIKTIPLWCQVIHNTNLSNSVTYDCRPIYNLHHAHLEFSFIENKYNHIKVKDFIQFTKYYFSIIFRPSKRFLWDIFLLIIGRNKKFKK